MTEYNVVADEKFGYFKLDPTPTNEALEIFYRDKYSELIKKGGRAPNIKKLLNANERGSELNWLRSTTFTDISNALKELLGTRNTLLDVGCGSGEFLDFLKEQSWETTGIEPSEELSHVASSRGLNVHTLTFENYLAKDTHEKFDVITLMNVLEHVPNPSAFILNCKKLLKENGIIVIKVPNDFSLMQKIIVESVHTKEYWIAIPDHINYFNSDSLNAFLTGHGFKVVYKLADFPMEFFLLTGDNYINCPSLGGECHKKRVAFELGLSSESRRKIYERFANAGIGRTLTFFISPGD